MQFSVPQFTDVEDKIVAGLSLKQFGIVFGAGALIFAAYSLTKSIIAVIVAALFLGLPAVFVAFGKINGRPIYAAFGNFIRYFTGAKMYVFHKQGQSLPETAEQTVEIKEQAPAINAQATVLRMKQLNYLLQQQAGEEQALLDRIAEEKRRVK